MEKIRTIRKYSINRTIIAGIFLFLFAACNSNRQDGESASITIGTRITNEDFRGIGFHVFYHIFEAPQWHYEQVFAKRWRELNPAFARITDIQGWSVYEPWDRKKIDDVSKYLEVMKDTDTELYFTTWGASAIYKHKSEIDYVRGEVDNLEYLKRKKGFDKLNYYCMTNELTMRSWSDLNNEEGLQYFKGVHQLFYDEFQKRKLGIKLLATDAAPIAHWNTIEWAAENMDDISGVYGGHHYINFDPLDAAFYPWFLDKMRWGAGIAQEKGKRFIIGEFGSKLNSNSIDGKHYDACRYNNKPLEPYAATQLAESMIAMINGGVYAAGYWTFNDCPDDAFPWGINKWGLSRWTPDDVTTRAYYYSVGLITKFLRGPATVYEVNSSDPLIRVCAIQNSDDHSVSIAIVNRNSMSSNVEIELKAAGSDLSFRKYVYNPEDVPFNYMGDLQDYLKKVSLENNRFCDDIPPMSLVVYTTKYDEIPPQPVKNPKIEKEERENGEVRFKLSWDANTEEDLCYYRVYKGEEEGFEISPARQVASTIGTEFNDLWENHTKKYFFTVPKYYYKVIAVDQSGNRSETGMVINK